MITPKMQLAFFDNATDCIRNLVQGMRIMASLTPAGAPVVRMADAALNDLNAMHDSYQIIRNDLLAQVAVEEKGESPGPLAARVAALETTVAGLHGALADAPAPAGVQKAVAAVEPLPESPAEPAEH